MGSIVRHSIFRHLGSLVVAILGTVGVIGLSLGMNAQVEKKVLEPVSVIEELAVGPTPKAAAKSRQRRAPTPRKTARSAPSPSPLLAANLSGLDFGLGDAADAALSQATQALVDDVGTAVMEEDAVQEPPTPTERVAPTFPARARALGQAGHVTLSFVVDVDGTSQDVHVVESDPPGVFDDAAVAAVREWRFDPGRHQGNPVAVRVRQTLRFELQ
ncbi:MAG: energy transducer TonB [Pseudomonadota bacterium]|nr:energy transducer TonB [Pseudomonadota bacterium]